jgi:hypothetical protein
MIQKRMGRLFVILFLGLLGVQLTGLSCLNDFPQDKPLSISATAHRSGADGINEDGQLGEDSCPCHLTFASVVNVPASAQGPIHPLAVVTPPVWRPLLGSFLFHPPKVL